MEMISYELFEQEFEKIKNSSYKNIVLITLQNMYHQLTDKEFKNLDTKNAIYIALRDRNMTFSNLQKELLKKSNIEDTDENAKKNMENAFFKVLSRKSKHGSIYKNILDILDIIQNDILRNSSFFQNKCEDTQWLFNSLLDEDKNAIYHLAILMQNPQQYSASIYGSLKQELSNIGIEECTDLPFS